MHSLLMARSSASSPPSLPARLRRAWLIFAAVALTVTGCALWISGEIGAARAQARVAAQARIDASMNAALLRTVLEKYRALPFVLSRDSALAKTLSANDPQALRQLDEKLETLSAGTKAAVIYAVRLDGIAVSASNWREPTSFVGNDYQFREYFKGALSNGQAEHFALGSVSRKPGLYISQRIDGENGPVGVIVVKVEFDAVEADWAASGKPSYVVDERGIVLITSIPSWRFMTIRPIPDDQLLAIRDSLQFGDAPLEPLLFDMTGEPDDTGAVLRTVMPGSAGRTAFLDVGIALATTSWTVQQLVPLQAPVNAGMREAQLLSLLALLPLMAGAAYLLRRRHVVALRIDREERARAELERRVETRTRDLSQARDQLQAEINDHRDTEIRLQQVQQDLVQANRLAILGQVAAGVAHEINQPLATIRAFADNARVFLDRGQTRPASENLDSIATLTERIAGITDELKIFARKGRSAAEPTAVAEVLEGAVLLLRSRFALQMDQLDIAMPHAALRVMGDRIRLEQVLINLLQNALEAVAPKGPDGRVEVRVREEGEIIRLTIADNGPGIAPDILADLFAPFNTSKESGLGLGLVISKDILADYGGTIAVESDSGGTRFAICLRSA